MYLTKCQVNRNRLCIDGNVLLPISGQLKLILIARYAKLERNIKSWRLSAYFPGSIASL